MIYLVFAGILLIPAIIVAVVYVRDLKVRLRHLAGFGMLIIAYALSFSFMDGIFSGPSDSQLFRTFDLIMSGIITGKYYLVVFAIAYASLIGLFLRDRGRLSARPQAL